MPRNEPDMNRKRQPPHRIGDALHLSDEELAQLAEIQPGDIAAAQAWARENGSRRFNSFLNALPADDEARK